MSLAWRIISATQRSDDREQADAGEQPTFWQTDGGQVRTRKASERTRDTHFLESAENGSSQETAKKVRARGTHILKDTEGQIRTKKQVNGRGHLLSGERGGQVRSGHRNEASEQGELTAWRA